MSLPVPLSVVLGTGRVTRRITRDLRSLSFRSVVPGGFASISMTLDRPLRLQPEEIAYYGTVRVVDGRNGAIVCEGRLEDPGRGSGSSGEIWQLSAVGPSAHAQDRRVPLIYVDRRLDPWIPSRYSVPSAQISSPDDADQVASIQIQFLRGTVVATTYLGDVMYHVARESGQTLGRVSCDHIEGVTDGNWRIKLLTRQDDGTSPGSVVDHQAWTTGQSIAGKVGDTNFSTAHNAANLRFDRDTAGVTVTDDVSYTRIKNIVVRTQLKDINGNDITSGYTSDTVLASDIVKDLLGRLLTKFDGPNARVDTTSYQITQLVYPDGTTAQEVLGDLIGFEQSFYWAAWEANAAGLYRFEWRAWPTTVRYEATTLDGFDSPGSADGLYNAVNVRWRDGARIRSTRRTQTVPELVAAGLTREGTIDLGDEAGSSAEAVRAGDQFLAERKTPPNAGRLTIARPILDRDTGRMVMPWEIRPGHLMRVRGVLPRLDALNATARDGVTVFRVTAADFDTDTVSAVLELDAPPPTVAQRLADVGRAPWGARRAVSKFRRR